MDLTWQGPIGTVTFRNPTCHTTQVHITAVVRYGGGERDGVRGEREKEKDGKRAVSNHGSIFFLFFPPPVK